MSLHAQLSPEAEARLHAQKRNSTISSIVISILVVILAALILSFFALKALLFESPTIVTYNAPLDEDDQIEQKQITDQIQRKPSAPSSSMAKVIASSTPSPTAIPVPEIHVPDPAAEFGSGDDFGAGWGTGGDGPGGDFGTIPETMRKRCSAADRMARLEANGGNPRCEEAVMAALRFFQKNQNKDGSWDTNHKVAMTGLVLLAYLGHCETPLSAEFGQTVTDSIVFLTDVAMKNNGKLSLDLQNKHWSYEHAIGAYALAEAYTFCSQLSINIPNLEKACQDSVQWIISNQHKSGGWDYNYDEDGPRGGDLSVTAWQMQALKAGNHTGLEFRNMRSTILNGLNYIRDCQDSNGGFGYTTNKKPVGGANGHYTLTGAGALCLQQHKGSANSSARKGIRYMDENCKFDWKAGPANLYEHYYVSQAMINHDGEAWAKYNKMVRDELLDNQQEDGSWGAPAGGGHGPNTAVYRTALCTLMLEVYYRFLPGTGQKN
ncbi:MAG: terpene cyclase/mutase family protein [Akkermansiaceae bacterium]|nr:terpene cyclase/mutase family protein [Akkermansiaceae bacterium]